MRYVLSKKDTIITLVSYAVGCMLGRYSLDVEGLAFAGGGFSEQWTVISGQYYRKEVVEKYGCTTLSGLGGVPGTNEDSTCPYRRIGKDGVCIEAGADHCPLTTDHFPADADNILPIRVPAAYASHA